MIVDIFCPIYVEINEIDLKKALKYYILRLLGDINISRLEIINVGRRYTKLEIEGKEEKIAVMYLKKFFGTKIRLDQISIGSEYPGRIMDINSNYLFVDIGEENLKKVQIQTTELIKAILGVRVRDRDLKPLLRLMGIRRFLLLVTRIKKITVNNGTTIYGDIGRRTINLYRAWFQDRLDRVLVFGTLRSHIDKILRRTKLYKEIVRVERLGFLEYAIVCKFGRFADDLADRLAKNGLKNLSIFMPRRIKKMIRKLGKPT